MDSPIPNATLGYVITFGLSFNFTSFIFTCPLELGEHKIYG